jgi:hypothetical protein
MRLHGVVLNELSTGIALLLPYLNLGEGTKTVFICCPHYIVFAADHFSILWQPCFRFAAVVNSLAYSVVLTTMMT